jgi:FG-GAP repeat protein
VAIGGRTVVVGAPFDDGAGGIDQGSAYVLGPVPRDGHDTESNTYTFHLSSFIFHAPWLCGYGGWRVMVFEWVMAIVFWDYLIIIGRM